MTPDQAVTQVREGLLIVEAALKAAGFTDDAKKVERHHAALAKIGKKHVTSGGISARSVGGDKPENP